MNIDSSDMRAGVSRDLCGGNRGFTLIEIVLVILLVGILAGVVGPLIGQLVRGYVETRQLNEYERQATLALERFVRDARGSDNDAPDQTVVDDGKGLNLVLGSGNAAFRIDPGGTLTVNGDVLARNVDYDASEFSIAESVGGGYPLIRFYLRIAPDNVGPLEFTASAVPRRNL